MTSLELIHALGAFGMTGVIWIIQLLVYPGFRYTEATQWPAHHRAHTLRITFVVFPLMAMQLVAAIMLYLQERSEIHLIYLVLASLVWFTTAIFFIPLHNKLGRRADHNIIKKLVSLNWMRTLLWTLTSALILFPPQH